MEERLRLELPVDGGAEKLVASRGAWRRRSFDLGIDEKKRIWRRRRDAKSLDWSNLEEERSLEKEELRSVTFHHRFVSSSHDSSLFHHLQASPFYSSGIRLASPFKSRSAPLSSSPPNSATAILRLLHSSPIAGEASSSSVSSKLLTTAGSFNSRALSVVSTSLLQSSSKGFLIHIESFDPKRKENWRTAQSKREE